MSFKRNLCTSTDSYKVTHWEQFPEGTEYSSYYIESRGGEYDELMVAGINFMTKVLEQGITAKDVEIARRVYDTHLGAGRFNYEGFMRIVNECEGKIPIRIKAVDEGMVVPVKNVLVEVRNTKPGFGWLPGYLEMFMLRAIWYQTTVATVSYHCKKAFVEYLQMTSDLTDESYDMVLKSRLHDFGGRGVSSEESAGLGGSAHLYNFKGTDTVEALLYMQEAFDDENLMAGFSIPAREHSTTTCYGRENEMKAYENSVQKFGSGIYACVMDSYDFEEAVRSIGRGKIREDIINAGGTFVVRPDSGNMIDNIMFALNELGESFGYTRNSKGYKVLHPSVRIIQGDEINSHEDIRRVLSWMETNKWAAENIAFGMGGGLLQKPNRDTLKFAMKMSAICIKGTWFPVYKSPKGAAWKESKKGILTLIHKNGQYKTINTMEKKFAPESEVLKLKFSDGSRYNNDTYQSIVKLSDQQSHA
ncbi:MAG: hypothetical protein [Caudoviricetes sp.]|nr:MAG: hypothetical protein [Caudoviricetes sp.]